MSQVYIKYEERIEMEVYYMCEKGYTIRQIAKTLNISKSTVHVDLTKRLIKYSRIDYLKVRKVLDLHIKQRAINGGEATRRKYLELR